MTEEERLDGAWATPVRKAVDRIHTANDLKATEARGYARGIEAAAKWHDDQAAVWSEMNIHQALSVATAKRHRGYAASLRALISALPGLARTRVSVEEIAELVSKAHCEADAKWCWSKTDGSIVCECRQAAQAIARLYQEREETP